MVGVQELTGVAMIVVAIPMLAMLRIARRNSDSAGSRGFFLVLPGAALWSLVSGVLTIAQSVTAFRYVWGFHILAANMLALGWALMALDYTRRKRVPFSRLQWAALLAIPVASQVLYWTNGFHHLIVGPDAYVDAAGVVQFEHGPWFYVHAVYNYVVLALTATVLLLRDFLHSEGIHRRQTGVLLVGAGVAVASSVGFTFDLPLPPYLDPAPFGFLVTMSLWTGAVFRFKLFTTVPIGRKTAMDTIPDALVLFDRNERVVDVNAAARELLGVVGDPTGSSAEELLDEFPNVLERLRDGPVSDADVSLVADGLFRHFSLTVRPVQYRGSQNGTLLLLRDVTTLRRRRQDLELLQRVLSRVLRHNLRNDLQGIRGRAELIAAQSDGEIAEQAEAIVGLTDDLAETSQKARSIEGVIDTQDQVVEQDACALVERAVEDVEERHPDAHIVIDGPDEAVVLGHYDLQDAVANLAENAVVHAESDSLDADVRVKCNGDWVTIDVVDDGPGIPEQEIAVLERQEETTLRHGQGAGLWLAMTLVEKSGGELSFSVSESGTTASLKLPAADDAR